MANPNERMNLEQVLTHLTALEAELDRVRQEADLSARLATLGLLSATAAHELRNLLTPVLSYAQMALADPDLTRKALSKTIEGVKGAAEILESTLEFATSADPASLDSSSNVGDILEKSLACLARDPARDGVELTIDVPSDLVVAIKPLSLQQVFMNLLLNAIKAMTRPPRGGRTNSVTISARVEYDQASAVIELTDTGPGIAPEIASHLFDPFVTTAASAIRHTDQQEPAAPLEGTGGSGLGLAICRRLTSEAGGSIAATSIPGQGATFSIRLPLAPTPMKKAG